MKQLMLKFFSATRLNVVLSAIFSVLLWISCLKGCVIAWLYARVWPLLGVKYFDQRFIWLGGPERWEWAERGLYAYMAGRPGCVVLDLACGDGLYPALFLTRVAGTIDAVDLDAKAIAHAQRKYGSASLRFVVGNMITDPFPRADYDMVSCFATFQYFDVPTAAQLTGKIATAVLRKNGRFVGSVPLFAPPLPPDPYAVHSFQTKAEVRDLLAIHFAQVDTWISTWAGGLQHCYFTCSQPKQVSHAALEQAVAEFTRRHITA